MKICKKCPEVGPQPENSFNPGRNICKKCRKKDNQKWYAEHREENNSKRRQWHLDHKEYANKESKRRYQENREQRQLSQRQWNATHREHMRAYHKEYRASHRTEILESNARRRALRRNAPLSEFIDRNGIYDRDSGKCHLCHRKVSRGKFHLDHLIPLFHGGPHITENVAIAHPRCNLSRQDGRIPAQLLLVEPRITTDGTYPSYMPHRSKLTPAQVLTILPLKGIRSAQALAIEHRVSIPTIYRIWRYASWAWMTRHSQSAAR